MQGERREVWLGDAARFGILQRLGIVGFILSFALFCISFGTPFSHTIYDLLVAAHAILYISFAMAAIADRIARRPFSCGRLVYVLGMWLVYAVSGPIIMSAAVAASPR